MIPARGPYSGESYRIYEDYNNIHVFVEDAGFENLYCEIFRRQELPIRKVFSKNGKAEVIDAAQKCNDPRCVYIVDRDWDDFLNIHFNLSNLVVLEKHSIENYLLSYTGFYSLVVAEFPKDKIESLFSEAIYQTLIDNTSNQLRPLFECYLAMQASGDRRIGCSQKPGHFQLKNQSCAPDQKAISGFIASIAIPIPKEVRDYFSGNVLCERGHGKYMLHYLWMGVREKTGARQIGTDQLMIRLAQGADRIIFKSFCDIIVTHSSNAPRVNA